MIVSVKQYQLRRISTSRLMVPNLRKPPPPLVPGDLCCIVCFYEIKGGFFKLNVCLLKKKNHVSQKMLRILVTPSEKCF